MPSLSLSLPLLLLSLLPSLSLPYVVAPVPVVVVVGGGGGASAMQRRPSRATEYRLSPGVVPRRRRGTVELWGGAQHRERRRHDDGDDDGQPLSTRSDSRRFSRLPRRPLSLLSPLTLLITSLITLPPLPPTSAIFPLSATPLLPPTALALEMSSGSGSKVNKDPQSLLRNGLPPQYITPSDRSSQSLLESVREDAVRKRYTAAEQSLKKFSQQAKKHPEYGVDGSVLDRVEGGLRGAKEANRGSVQEDKAREEVLGGQGEAMAKFQEYEEGKVPRDYKVDVPSEYGGLARLDGRATVVMTLEKKDGMPFDIDGTNYPKARMKMVVDGYTSPLTGGNFVELVSDGFYTGMEIQRSDGFVVQTGDPEGKAEGVVKSGGAEKTRGRGKNGERLLPLEIMLKGDPGPLYGSTNEDEGRGGEATVLPFSAYGAMGWAREEYDANSGSSQFFWLLFDSDLMPGGKNVLDGRYPCFGYVVEGGEFLRDVREGDVITEAKVVEGLGGLVRGKD